MTSEGEFANLAGHNLWRWFVERRRRKQLDEVIASATPTEFLANLRRLDTRQRRDRRIYSLWIESAQRVNADAFAAWLNAGRR